MHMNLLRSTLALALLVPAVPATAQNREHQQMSAELRMLQEQQQQLALARALVGRPRVLLLDEPTEGIQPSVIWEIERAIDQLRSRSDLSILLVEQFVEFAIDLADAYYLMDRGTIVANGPAADLTEEIVRQHLAV